jgi:hypothetical protein
MNLAGLAFYQKLSLITTNLVTGCPTNLELLNMDVLVPALVPRFTESDLEYDVFACIAIQIEFECI